MALFAVFVMYSIVGAIIGIAVLFSVVVASYFSHHFIWISGIAAVGVIVILKSLLG